MTKSTNTHTHTHTQSNTHTRTRAQILILLIQFNEFILETPPNVEFYSLKIIIVKWYFIIWFRLQHCDTDRYLDPLCDEINTEGKIQVTATHGWVCQKFAMTLSEDLNFSR